MATAESSIFLVALNRSYQPSQQEQILYFRFSFSPSFIITLPQELFPNSKKFSPSPDQIQSQSVELLTEEVKVSIESVQQALESIEPSQEPSEKSIDQFKESIKSLQQSTAELVKPESTERGRDTVKNETILQTVKNETIFEAEQNATILESVNLSSEESFDTDKYMLSLQMLLMK